MGHTLNEEPLACEACFQWALSCESSILSLVLSSLLAVFHEESAAVLLVVMYGESDQGLQVLRSAADVCVCVCVLNHAVVLVNTFDVITQLFPLAHLWYVSVAAQILFPNKHARAVYDIIGFRHLTCPSSHRLFCSFALSV